MKRYILPIIALCALACTREIDAPTSSPRPEQSGSEVGLDSTMFVAVADTVNKVWVAGTEVLIYDGVADDPLSFAVENIEGAECTLRGEVTSTSDLYVALYPSQAFTAYSERNATMVVPVEQTLPNEYATIALPSAPAVAMNGLKTLEFSSVATYVSVNLTAENVKSFTLSPKSESKLSGEVDFAVYQREVVEIRATDNVTLKPSGESFSKGTYKVQVLPGSYPDGFTVPMTFTDDNVYSHDLDQAVEVEFGKTAYAGLIHDDGFDAPIVSVSNVAFTSAELSWDAIGVINGYNVYVNGIKVNSEMLSVTTKTLSLTGLVTGIENTVEVEAVGLRESKKSESLKVKTAGVYEVENNTGTSFVCIGWDDLARDEVDGKRQAYQIQVYEDMSMSSLVYDITPFTGNNNNDNYPFGNGSYLGKSSKPQTASGLKCDNILTPTRISVGGLYPNTTYYVRVRTRASYVNTPDEDKKEITHSYGDSPWSDLVPMTTDAEHVPAANEVIYGGFNDFCVQTDFLSPAIGARLSDYKKALAWDTVKANGTLHFQFYAFGHGLHQGDSYLLAQAGVTRIDGTKNPLVSTGSTIHRGNAKGTGNTYIGDMKDWIWAGWTRPCMGAIALDGVGTFVATPPLSADKLSAEGTDCNLSFTAAFRVRIADNPDVTADGLQIQVWRAAEKKYEVIKTYKVGDLLPYDPATATTTDVVNDYDRNEISCDLNLHPGDNVELVSQFAKYLIIDDILIVTKK